VVNKKVTINPLVRTLSSNPVVVNEKYISDHHINNPRITRNHTRKPSVIGDKFTTDKPSNPTLHKENEQK
jgi:hypothetical protein